MALSHYCCSTTGPPYNVSVTKQSQLIMIRPLIVLKHDGMEYTCQRNQQPLQLTLSVYVRCQKKPSSACNDS